MASCSLKLTGQVVVGGACGCDSSSPSQKIQALGFSCPDATYQAIAGTECPVQVQTSGIPGQNWVDCPATKDLAGIRLLVLKASNPLVVRIGAGVALLQGSAGTFPTGFSGGQTFSFKADGVLVAVTFQSGDQSAAQVASRINQAAVAAGLSYLPATVLTSGQLQLQGALTGSQGSVEVTVTNSTIGFPTATKVFGAGSDQTLRTAILEFDPFTITPPARIQLSGTARVEVLAAGDPLAA